MNHITQAQAMELAAALDAKNGRNAPLLHELCNAAIEWHIAQQAAPKEPVNQKLVEALERMVFAFTPLSSDATLANLIDTAQAALDLYKNSQNLDTSQERVEETAKSEQVPLTDEEVQALAICREDRRVSVSKIQRKLCVGYSHAHVICQSIIDKGQCGGLLISPQLTTFGIKETKV